jgi:hypothetical protein
MDELARRYILLCLRLGRLVPGLVDSYNGPAELSEAVAAEPAPLAPELHDEAMALRAAAAELDPGANASLRRRRWLDGQLRAMAALARRAGGEQIAYADLVEQLYGVPITPVLESDLQAARARLDEALPGGGSLSDRLAQHRSTLRIPPERIVSTIRSSAARFREVTRRYFDLPDREGIEWEEAHAQPWGAYATFVGHGTTRIILNIDLPQDVASAAYLAWHEAYPGHHAEHAIKERTLVDAGVAEATMRTMNTPEATLAEGQADVAREVVMTDPELGDELARIGHDLGIESDWPRAVAVHLAMADLAPVGGNAALMMYRDGMSIAEVRRWVREISALDSERIDHLFRVLGDPFFSTYPFTYTEGARLIRAWLQVTGSTAGFRRLLSEQLSPAQLHAELAAAAPA